MKIKTIHRNQRQLIIFYDIIYLRLDNKIPIKTKIKLMKNKMQNERYSSIWSISLVFFSIMLGVEGQFQRTLDDKNNINIVLEKQQSYFELIDSLVDKHNNVTNQQQYKRLTLSRFHEAESKHEVSNGICMVESMRSMGLKDIKYIDEEPLKKENIIEWQRIRHYEGSTIYKLSDLQNLQYVLDIKLIENKIIVIMEDGRLAFYTLDQSGNIVDIQTNYVKGMQPLNISRPKNPWRGQEYQPSFQNYSIPTSLNPGFLLNNVFISSSQLISINPQTMRSTFIQGYQPLQHFQHAIQSQDKIMIAAGQEGIIRYQYDFEKDQAKKTKQYLIKTQTQEGQQIVTASQIIEIKAPKSFMNHTPIGYFVLDQDLGVVYLSYQQIVINQTQQNQYQEVVGDLMIQQKGCRTIRISHNGHKSSHNLYLSCPHVIQYIVTLEEISLHKRNIQVTKSNFGILDISPTEIIVPTFQQPLVTIISHKSFKIFDYCLQKVINQGYFPSSFHHTISLPFTDNMYASVNDLSLIVWTLRPQKWYLSCHDSNIKTGKYQATMLGHKDCRYGSEKNSQCCFDEYSVNVEITEHKSEYHVMQITIIILTLWVSSVVGIWLAIKHVKINKEYKQLSQQIVFEQTLNQKPSLFISNLTEQNSDMGKNMQKCEENIAKNIFTEQDEFSNEPNNKLKEEPDDSFNKMYTKRKLSDEQDNKRQIDGGESQKQQSVQISEMSA